MAKRMRSPGAGNLVVMLLPVMTIMSRVSLRPCRLRRLASHATASKGWPSASPVLPWPLGASLIQQRVDPGLQIDPAPGRHRRAEDHPAVPGVLGDEGEGVEGLVVGVAILDQLEGGQARGDLARHRCARPRPTARGQVVAQADRHLELDAEVMIGARARAGAARGARPGEDRAGGGLVHARHLLHGLGGERDLPAGDLARPALAMIRCSASWIR